MDLDLDCSLTKLLILYVLYRGKEKIYSETELIIYQLNCYSLTSVISLSL